MSVFGILHQIIISPLIYIFDCIYGLSLKLVNDSALAIIPLSLAVNLLCLPLFIRADAIQQENRRLEKKMEPWLKHIKTHFFGDERFMMTQTYYKICHYKPIYMLRNSISIFMQIPFFMAAYQVLSKMPSLNGKSFGPIMDLGLPDGLLVIGNTTINLLPIIMTGINLVSSRIYTRQGVSNKDRVQLTLIALVFLILLYNSPAGLVFYWILNQIFSLGKNIVMGSKDKKKTLNNLYCILSISGIVLLLFSVKQHAIEQVKATGILMIGFLFQIPLFYNTIKKSISENGRNLSKRNIETVKEDNYAFILTCIALTILTGILIPSELIKSSTWEFSNIWDYHSPILHLVNASLTALGLFVLWVSVFYYLFKNRAKCIFGFVLFLILGISITDYFFFGTNMGTISSKLQYVEIPTFEIPEILLNFFVISMIIVISAIAWRIGRRFTHTVLSVLIVVLIGMSSLNISSICSDIPQIEKIVEQESLCKTPSITLSRNGKNVIVLMMDRCISGFIPYLFNEKPELVRMYDGFVYYPNTISYGNVTYLGSPGLYGGYDYTPQMSDYRSEIPLRQKQNEALLVMPLLFSEANYDVTVCDPSLANYTAVPDLSIYSEYKKIHAYNTLRGQFVHQEENSENLSRIWQTNIFRYSLMKTAPVLFQGYLYDNSCYLFSSGKESILSVSQIAEGLSNAEGINELFINNYAVLESLPTLTNVTDEKKDTFLMMSNNSTHEPMLLQEPDYEVSSLIDNTTYEAVNEKRFYFNDRFLSIGATIQMGTYHVHMASLKALGVFFDYLRDQGVYDNTRIIIVADHGHCLSDFFDMRFGNQYYEDAMWYNPALLVKDFNSTGFTEDDAFMTNCDTPTLAMNGLILNPVNPFTGNEINSDRKNEEDHLIYSTYVFNQPKNLDASSFTGGRLFLLHGNNLFDMNAWEYIGDY